jgi:hypothetical protein
MLFIIHTKAITLSTCAVIIGASGTTRATGARALPMVSITAFTIYAIKVGFAYEAGVPIGVAGEGTTVCSCRAVLFVCDDALKCLKIVSS